MDMIDLTNGVPNTFHCPFSAIKKTLEKHFSNDLVEAFELIVDAMNVLNNENQQMRKHILEMQTEMINILKIVNDGNEIINLIGQRLGVSSDAK